MKAGEQETATIKVRGCPLCGNQYAEELSLFQSTNMVTRCRCNLCGLVYLLETDYPLPVYDWEYNKHFHRPGDMRKAGARAGQIAEIADCFKRRARILEIGPGNGLTAVVLQHQNYNIMVVEMSEDCSDFLKASLHIPTWTGRFEDMEYCSEFDIIYASDVIEHSLDPVKFFRKAHERLADDGVFFVATPDTHYAKKHGVDWHHYLTRTPYEHCHLFTVNTIDKLAQLTGFEIESCRSFPEYENMEVILKKQNNGHNTR